MLDAFLSKNLVTQGFGKTDRKDAWWWEQVFTIVALTVFGFYGIYRAFENGFYEVGPYLSPFYSPNLKAMFPESFEWLKLSPAFLILWAPLGFRGTCYFYRRTYYRAIFNDPPACAVDKPKQGFLRPLADYTGETLFPFVLQNFHRYFLYVALILVVFHWVHAFESLMYNGQIGFGVGSLIIWLDTIMLTLYVFSCHSLRHLIGGRLNSFTGGFFSRLAYLKWFNQTKLNQEHWFYAWVSLFTVGLCDLYIRLVASGAITDWNTWGVNWSSAMGCSG